MTDNEIIKALEYCTDGEDCDGCPYRTTASCSHRLRLDVVNLTNRQKAEIEDLKSQMEWLTGYNGNLLDANTALSGEIEICKSEAIKEFAERLDRKFAFYYPDTQCISVLVVRKSIQNELTEMTESKK